MATFIRSVLQSRVTIPVATVLDTILPPNPISHLIIAMRWATSAQFVVPTYAQILAGLSNIEVLHRGSSVYALSMQDAFAYQAAVLGAPPAAFRINDDLANAVGQIGIIIPFGRSIFQSNECFPATRAGELILRLTRPAADAGYTTPTFTIESVELPEAQPTRFIRGTTLAFSPTVVGDNDFQLYPSTVYAGLLGFSTTVPTGIVNTTTLDRVKLLLNNIEYDISQSNWETAWAEWMLSQGPATSMYGHTHRENTAGAYAQNAETLTPILDVHPLRQYLWHSFYPTWSDEYLIDARGVARVTLRVTAGDTQPARVIPVELIDTVAA